MRRDKRRALKYVALAVSLCPGLAFAQGWYPDRGLVRLDNSASGALVYSHMGYGERVNGPGTPYFDTSSGFLEGGHVALTGLGGPISNLYIRLAYGATYGNLQYVGGLTQGGVTTPVVEPENEQIADASIRVGLGVVTSRHTLLLPYVTYGARHWDRGTYSDNCLDCLESYRNGYVAVGALWQAALSRSVALGLNIAYGETVQPTINVPGLFAEYLGPRPWGRAGVSIDFWVAPQATVFASAVFTTFAYGAGPVVNLGCSGGTCETAYEPYSRTETTRYSMGVRYLY